MAARGQPVTRAPTCSSGTQFPRRPLFPDAALVKGGTAPVLRAHVRRVEVRETRARPRFTPLPPVRCVRFEEGTSDRRRRRTSGRSQSAVARCAVKHRVRRAADYSCPMIMM